MTRIYCSLFCQLDMKEGKPYEYPYCISQPHRIGERGSLLSYEYYDMKEKVCPTNLWRQINHSVINIKGPKYKMMDIEDKLKIR